MPVAGERVLDVACGMGIVTRLIAEQVDGRADLAGIDLSAAMIDMARARSAEEGAEFVWHVGGVNALPFPAGSFGLVLVRHGLQYFSDRTAAMGESRCVLAQVDASPPRRGRRSSAAPSVWRSSRRFSVIWERRPSTLISPWGIGMNFERSSWTPVSTT